MDISVIYNKLFDNEGICSACKCHESRDLIDWKKRQEAFDEVVANAKTKNAACSAFREAASVCSQAKSMKNKELFHQQIT